MDRQHDVFISHPSQDKNVATAMCSYLEKENVKCWIAPRDIMHGEDYGAGIIRGIANSKIMVIVFSHHSNASNFVKNEIERAFKHNLIIIPFRIEDVAPTESLEYFLGSTHWLDAYNGKPESYFKDLFNSIQYYIGKPLTPPVKEEAKVIQPIITPEKPEDKVFSRKEHYFYFCSYSYLVFLI
ncbi:MAG: toll/interleukin-1 receptor domain-containing protein [Bacteroidales bacterium]|nr:toll/interleukin-1 receptor domain-containing protein [Bacteroidales bacterium]